MKFSTIALVASLSLTEASITPQQLSGGLSKDAQHRLLRHSIKLTNNGERQLENENQQNQEYENEYGNYREYWNKDQATYMYWDEEDGEANGKNVYDFHDYHRMSIKFQECVNLEFDASSYKYQDGYYVDANDHSAAVRSYAIYDLCTGNSCDQYMVDLNHYVYEAASSLQHDESDGSANTDDAACDDDGGCQQYSTGNWHKNYCKACEDSIDVCQ